MKNTRRLQSMCLASAVIALLACTSVQAVRKLSFGDVCRFSNISKCECEGGEFQPIFGGDRQICAPKFKKCTNSSQIEDLSCSCCGDLNGHLSAEQCLPSHLCSAQYSIDSACDNDAQCETMVCEQFICREPPLSVVRRMLQDSNTNTTTTTNTTTVAANTTNETSVNVTTLTNSTNVTSTNVTVAIVDPVQNQNYSCFRCAQLGFGFDLQGCFNQTLQASRLTTKTATTSKGCFILGQWVQNNSEFIDIGNQKVNNTTFVYTKQCNKTGDEFYLMVTNNLYHVNSLSSAITSLSTDNTTTDAIVDTYCGNAANGQCNANDTRSGFFNYSTTQGEKIEFYFYCNGKSEYNATLNITAYWVSDIEGEFQTGLSGGGIAGIVIACVVVFLFAVGYTFGTQSIVDKIKSWKCCKSNKTSNLPDDSPRQPNDIDRRETGLAGNQADGQAHNPVSIQHNDTSKRSNGPLIDPDLMSATSAPFPGQDLNSTGQHLLSQLKHGQSDYNTGAGNDRNIGSAPGTGMPTSPSAQGGLPNIHTDKKGAAQGWNALDSERRGQSNDEESGKVTSKRELTKDHSEAKE